MTDIWFAGALAALSRFIRLRKKRKNPDGERIEVPHGCRLGVAQGDPRSEVFTRHSV